MVQSSLTSPVSSGAQCDPSLAGHEVRGVGQEAGGGRRSGVGTEMGRGDAGLRMSRGSVDGLPSPDWRLRRESRRGRAK